MEDVNCDKMIDRPGNSDRVLVTMRQSGPLKTQLCDVIVCPKACYSSTTHSNVCTFAPSERHPQAELLKEARPLPKVFCHINVKLWLLAVNHSLVI